METETIIIDGKQIEIEYEQRRRGWLATVKTESTLASLAGKTKEDIIEQIKRNIHNF